MSEKNDDFLRVVNIEVLAGGPEEGVVSDTFLRFELDDQRQFMMSSIPTEIAIELHQYVNNMEANDSTSSISWKL